jgi:4-hydroxyacetophenone monooxygenase
MPAIAQKAAHLTVFQRTPAWIVPIENYRWPIPDGMQMLFDRIPHYWNWYCFANFFPWMSDLSGLHSYDREWQRTGGFVSQRSDAVRQGVADYLKAKLADRPDLIPKLTPTYAPWSKRPVMDNGFYDALKQPNVSLVTTPIKRMTAAGIETSDGVEHRLDAIILGSGFDISRYMSPIKLTGRGGVTLDQLWEKDGSRAYLGLTIPRMPNFFMIFGPNAGMKTVSAGTWIECWARYAVEAIIMMLERGHRSMECRREVYEQYNTRLDAVSKEFIWEGEGIATYYINKHKRSVMMVPWEAVDYYAWIRRPKAEDYGFV